MRQVSMFAKLISTLCLTATLTPRFADGIPDDAASGTPLMHNGGVEENNGKTAPGYDLSGFGVKLDSTVAHAGRYSIRTVCDATHTSLFTSPKAALPPPNDRPRRIVVRAWIRSKNLTIVHQGGWSAASNT